MRIAALCKYLLIEFWGTLYDKEERMGGQTVEDIF